MRAKIESDSLTASRKGREGTLQLAWDTGEKLIGAKSPRRSGYKRNKLISN